MQKIGKKIKENGAAALQRPGQNVGPEPGPTGRADRSGGPVGSPVVSVYQSRRSEPVGSSRAKITKGRTGRTDRSRLLHLQFTKSEEDFACGFPQCSLEKPDRSGRPVGLSCLEFEAVAPTGSCLQRKLTGMAGPVGPTGRTWLRQQISAWYLMGCLRQDLPVCHSVGWSIKGNI